VTHWSSVIWLTSTEVNRVHELDTHKQPATNDATSALCLSASITMSDTITNESD